MQIADGNNKARAKGKTAPQEDVFAQLAPGRRVVVDLQGLPFSPWHCHVYASVSQFASETTPEGRRASFVLGSVRIIAKRMLLASMQAVRVPQGLQMAGQVPSRKSLVGLGWRPFPCQMELGSLPPCWMLKGL